MNLNGTSELNQQGSASSVNTINDAKEYADMVKAMTGLGFSSSEIDVCVKATIALFS